MVLGRLKHFVLIDILAAAEQDQNALAAQLVENLVDSVITVGRLLEKQAGLLAHEPADTRKHVGRTPFWQARQSFGCQPVRFVVRPGVELVGHHAQYALPAGTAPLGTVVIAAVEDAHEPVLRTGVAQQSFESFAADKAMLGIARPADLPGISGRDGADAVGQPDRHGHGVDAIRVQRVADFLRHVVEPRKPRFQR